MLESAHCRFSLFFHFFETVVYILFVISHFIYTLHRFWIKTSMSILTIINNMNNIKQLTLITLTLSIMAACRPSETQKSDYFLLLKDEKTISVNTYKNDKIIEIKTFTISEKSIFTTDQKEKVAILDTQKNTITIYEIHTSKETELSIPYDIIPRSILLNEDNLFIGGEMNKELLIQHHIQSGKWHQLEIPKEIHLWSRKAIDDLLVNDSLLIAVDNEVLPKYILFYRLENTNEKLALSHFVELLPNRANETIFQGRITPDYFGLRSNTFTLRRGNGKHITIYNTLDLTESFAISVFTDIGEEKDETYNDFLIIDNTVVIASSKNGLGLFKIEKSYFKGADYKSLGLDYNLIIIDPEISYKAYENEHIIRLTQIPKTKKIVLTIENDTKNIRHEMMEIGEED